MSSPLTLVAFENPALLGFVMCSNQMVEESALVFVRDVENVSPFGQDTEIYNPFVLLSSKITESNSGNRHLRREFSKSRFGLFEFPILQVFECLGNFDQGKSCRVVPPVQHTSGFVRSESFLVTPLEVWSARSYRCLGPLPAGWAAPF